jgi:hypothetical protein
MSAERDTVATLVSLTRAARDASLSSADRSDLMDAIEALARSIGTSDFGEQYSQLLALGSERPSVGEAIGRGLSGLAGLLH